MCTCSSSFHASTLCASTVPQPLTDNDTKKKKPNQKTKQSGFLTASTRGKKGPRTGPLRLNGFWLSYLLGFVSLKVT